MTKITKQKDLYYYFDSAECNNVVKEFDWVKMRITFE